MPSKGKPRSHPSIGNLTMAERSQQVLSLPPAHPCALEEVKHSTQKERRFIDTPDPVMQKHILVFNRQVIQNEFDTANSYKGDAKYT